MNALNETPNEEIALEIRRNFDFISEQIAYSCKKVGRKKSDIRLIAVTKKQPNQIPQIAYELGLRDFGENYVQELKRKRELLPDLSEARWHLIGPLQKNKVRDALLFAQEIQALDSREIIDVIQRKWVTFNLDRPIPVYLQVNVDREESKSGILPEELFGLYEFALSQSSIQVQGLMCIPRVDSSEIELRKSFSSMRDLSERLVSQYGLPMWMQKYGKLLLNMGMSRDFHWAIEEGADCVRIGTALFGAR